MVNKVWLAYLSIKIVYMFFALNVYARFTQLGDTERYIDGPTFGSYNFWLNSTEMMDFIAHGISIVSHPLISHFFFVLLSFWGVYYPLKKMQVNQKELTVLLVFLSFPSFGVWTSIASKESVTVFFMGILLGLIIDLSRSNKIRNYLLILISFYLCLLFKPQYLVAVMSTLMFIFLARRFHMGCYWPIIIMQLFAVSSILLLYFTKDYIDQASFMMVDHFSTESSSTRANDIWVERYDVFWNAPLGMMLAFWGPTPSEALSNVKHLMVFLESMVIFAAFIFFVLKIILASITKHTANFYSFGVFVTSFIWILFVHYPFGVLNPGSAIRYREGFYAYLLLLFAFCYLGSLKANKKVAYA